jgi:hypothetical protein
MSMVYLVPSRGRPENARALITAWRTTRAGAALVFVVDEDDPDGYKYINVVEELALPGVRVLFVPKPSRRGMVEGLNLAAVRECWSYEYVGFMGDDHRPRTTHWDLCFENEFKRSMYLLLYGDDLVQRSNLPTAVVMRAEVIQRLGFMAPPPLQHMYVDNYWRALGEPNRIKFMPEVTIEHVHPIGGSVPWDEGYLLVNNGAVYDADGKVFSQFVTDGIIAEDRKKIEDIV